MSTRSSVAGILICGFTALVLAQAPPAPPKPGPEYKKLEYFLGTWKEEGEIKANGYVSAGKGVTTGTYTLGPGGFSVERRAEGQIPNTFGIIAYDSYAKAYTTFYASSAGLVGTPASKMIPEIRAPCELATVMDTIPFSGIKVGKPRPSTTASGCVTAMVSASS